MDPRRFLRRADGRVSNCGLGEYGEFGHGDKFASTYTYAYPHRCIDISQYIYIYIVYIYIYIYTTMYMNIHQHICIHTRRFQ